MEPQAPGGKTVFRGAYTLSSYLEGTGTNLRLPMNPPVRQPNFGASYSVAADGPLPPTTTDQGLIIPPAGNPFQGAELRLWNPNDKPAAVQQWNFSIQHQFSNNTTLQASYVGQHGTHLMEPELYSQSRPELQRHHFAEPVYLGKSYARQRDRLHRRYRSLPARRNTMRYRPSSKSASAMDCRARSLTPIPNA